MSGCDTSGSATPRPVPLGRAGDACVVEARRPQRTFGDGFVADAVVDLQEAWMRQANAILDDEELLAHGARRLGPAPSPQPDARPPRGAR